MKKLEDAQTKKNALEYFQNHKDEFDELSKKFDFKNLKPNDIEALKAKTKDFKGAIEKKPDNMVNNGGPADDGQLMGKVVKKPRIEEQEAEKKAQAAAKAGGSSEQADWFEGLTEHFVDAIGGDFNFDNLDLQSLLDGSQNDRFNLEELGLDKMGFDKDFFSGFGRLGDVPSLGKLDLPSFSLPDLHLPALPHVSMPEIPALPKMPSWGAPSMPSTGGFGGAAGGTGLLQVLLWVGVLGLIGFMLWKFKVFTSEMSPEARRDSSATGPSTRATSPHAATWSRHSNI